MRYIPSKEETEEATKLVLQDLYTTDCNGNDPIGYSFSMDNVPSYSRNAKYWLGEYSELSAHIMNIADWPTILDEMRQESGWQAEQDEAAEYMSQDVASMIASELNASRKSDGTVMFFYENGDLGMTWRIGDIPQAVRDLAQAEGLLYSFRTRPGIWAWSQVRKEHLKVLKAQGLA